MLARSLTLLLAAAALVLVLLGAASAVSHPGLLPAQLADYRGKFTPEQYEGRHWLRTILLVPCALLSVFATASLIRNWRGAPIAYFASAVATMVVVEFLRPYVHPGSGEDYYELAIPLMAVLLFLLFFTPVKEWYRPNRAPTEPGSATDQCRA